MIGMLVAGLAAEIAAVLATTGALLLHDERRHEQETQHAAQGTTNTTQTGQTSPNT